MDTLDINLVKFNYHKPPFFNFIEKRFYETKKKEQLI
jgi:hypothetical protein